MLLHLIRSDARRIRLTIAAWLTLVVCVTALDSIVPALPDDPRSTYAIGLAHALLWLAMQLLAILIVALVFHTHPAVGTDAFWMTRPIPPRLLVTAKLALLTLLMVVVPLVSQLSLMVIYQIPAGNAARVSLQGLTYHSLWLALFVAAAALTPNLAKFAALCGAAVASLAVGLAVSAALVLSRMEDAPAMGAVGIGIEGTDPTATLAANLTLIGAGFVLTHVQYRTRLRRRAAIVAALGLALASFVASAWPWPILRAEVVTPEWTQTETSLRLAVDAETIKFGAGFEWPRGDRWRTATARMRVSGVEPGWLPTLSLLDGAVQFGNDRLVSSGTHVGSVPMEDSAEAAERQILLDLLDVRKLGFPSLPRSDVPIFVARTDDLARHAGKTGIYRARFRVDLTLKEIAAVLPLRAPQNFTDTPYRLTIDEISPAGLNRLSIRARESNPTSMFDRRQHPVREFYLRNQATGEAIPGYARPRVEGSLLPFLGMSSGGRTGFVVRGASIHFSPAVGRDEDAPSLDAEWLHRAELVIVRSTPRGSVVRTLEIPAFRVEEK